MDRSPRNMLGKDKNIHSLLNPSEEQLALYELIIGHTRMQQSKLEDDEQKEDYCKFRVLGRAFGQCD